MDVTQAPRNLKRSIDVPVALARGNPDRCTLTAKTGSHSGPPLDMISAGVCLGPRKFALIFYSNVL